MAYTILSWIGAVFLTVFWGSLSLASSLFSKTGDFSHLCMQIWSRQNLRIAGTKLHVTGLSNASTSDGAKVFAANHQSMLDILVLAAILPVKFRWIAKKELFRIPFLGWHMKRAGYIAIDRSERSSAARTIMDSVQTLRQGMSLVIFPEETRSPDGRLQEFKRGGFALAVKAGVSVVPVAIQGTGRAIRKGDLRLHRTEVRVDIAAPIAPPPGGRREAQEELMQATRRAILDRLGPEQPAAGP
jgi:1-acyl-sn-glycerol-3-phosphate acyltransferase